MVDAPPSRPRNARFSSSCAPGAPTLTDCLPATRGDRSLPAARYPGRWERPVGSDSLWGRLVVAPGSIAC